MCVWHSCSVPPAHMVQVATCACTTPRSLTPTPRHCRARTPGWSTLHTQHARLRRLRWRQLMQASKGHTAAHVEHDAGWCAHTNTPTSRHLLQNAACAAALCCVPVCRIHPGLAPHWIACPGNTAARRAGRVLAGELPWLPARPLRHRSTPAGLAAGGAAPPAGDISRPCCQQQPKHGRLSSSSSSTLSVQHVQPTGEKDRRVHVRCTRMACSPCPSSSTT